VLTADDTRRVRERAGGAAEHSNNSIDSKDVGAREIRSNQADVASVPEEFDWNGEVQLATSRVEPKKF
jgi:hypothetical protein